MKSFYHAYRAYENRVIRGEMDGNSGKAAKRPELHETPLSRLGDLLIRAGLELKRKQVTGQSVAWPSLAGSKP